MWSTSYKQSRLASGDQNYITMLQMLLPQQIGPDPTHQMAGLLEVLLLVWWVRFLALTLEETLDAIASHPYLLPPLLSRN